MDFRVVIDPLAIRDVQEAINYYDEQLASLGKKFLAELNKKLTLLEKNPFLRIRYDSVRCIPLKNFPYLVHFTVDENKNTVHVRAVFHTSLDPEKWVKRK